MIDSVKTRLTLWYVAVLALVLIAFSFTLYALVSRSLYKRVDASLHSLLVVATRSLTHDAEEGQSIESAAQSTAAELSQPQQALLIFDLQGRLLAENHPDEDFQLPLPDFGSVSADELSFYTSAEKDDADEYHRLALRRVIIPPMNRTYILVASQSLEEVEEELEVFRGMLLPVGASALLLAGLGGWLLARKSLAPVLTMAESARRIGTGNLGRQIPVANPRDELGQLATTFNELLSRLHESFARQQQTYDQQRQFMADASHELRTPLSVLHTAAGVTLRQRHRSEEDYREIIRVMDKEIQGLAQIVKDLFLLSLADADRYPLQKRLLYLNDLLEEVVRAVQLLATEKGVRVVIENSLEADYYGDEDLLRRMLLNLVHNAIQHTPAGSTIRIDLRRDENQYLISVTNPGEAIPEEARNHIFERFFRVDKARTRTDAITGTGAGLGLSIALWIAQAHGGTLTLASSDFESTTFVASLPHVSPS